MDYEKKYKETIEKLRSFYKNYDTVSCLIDVKEELANLFPELKESEDERIRKAIYNCVKWFGFDSCYFKDVSQEKCLAWLEKQGEQKSIDIESIKTEFYNAGYKDGKEYNQKPAWSEEDEENLNWFEKFFRAESVIAGGKDIPQDRYLWFKNLKDRVQPKPKQEWSEKDEELYDEIRDAIYYSDCVETAEDIENMKETLFKAANWMEERAKSLKPQPQWKPSNEQIRILELAIDYWKPNDVSVTTPLYNLLEQLKKLREE